MSENAAKTLKDLQRAWSTIAQEHVEMGVIQYCQFRIKVRQWKQLRYNATRHGSQSP